MQSFDIAIAISSGYCSLVRFRGQNLFHSKSESIKVLFVVLIDLHHKILCVVLPDSIRRVMGARLKGLLAKGMVSISPSVGAVFLPEVEGHPKLSHLWQKISLFSNKVELGVSEIAKGRLDSEVLVESVRIRMHLDETVHELVEGRFFSFSPFHAGPHPSDSVELPLIMNFVEITRQQT